MSELYFAPKRYSTRGLSAPARPPPLIYIKRKMKTLNVTKTKVNVAGRVSTVRAKRMVSLSYSGLAPRAVSALTEVAGIPHAEQVVSPAPTSAPQLRHIVGRPA